jgi:organic radical activating enzyme
MSNVFEVSEVFMSLEGESKYTFHPTVYARLAVCNFKCPKFNNPDNQVTANGYATLTFNPSDYSNIKAMPFISAGCDSQYSVSPEFRHTWAKMTGSELAAELVSKLPHQSWLHPKTNLPVIFSITGGEPTMQWKWLHEIFRDPAMSGCQHILMETNCAVPFKESFTQQIDEWLSEDASRRWTWSNSPKLSVSGEPWSKAIKPQIAVNQMNIRNINQVDQYFKFVVTNTRESFDEVLRAMDEYWAAGIPQDTQIWAMPMACTGQQQTDVAREVAELCLEYGFLYSHRIQNVLWDNIVGT